MLEILLENSQTAPYVQELELFAEGKLWRQFQLKLEELLLSDVFGEWKSENMRVPLLKTFFSEYYTRLVDVMNPMNYVRVCLMVFEEVKMIEGWKSSIAFLDEVMNKVLKDDDAKLVIECKRIAEEILEGENVSSNFKRLQDIQEKVEERLEAPSLLLYSHLYYTLIIKWRYLADTTNLYKATFKYLSYVPLGEIDNLERAKLLVESTLAALLSNEVYNTGELICHDIFPLFDSMEDYKWLKELLLLFTQGNIDEFTGLLDSLEGKISEGNESYISTILENKNAIMEKVKVMSLLELAFREEKGKDITLDQIVDFCKIERSEFEFLVMRAMDAGLIRGKINQVDMAVHIDWILPRVLNKDQIANTLRKIQNWRTNAEFAVSLIEKNASELIMKT